MNKITHKLALWRLESMIIRANKLDSRIETLATKISKYEKLKFTILSQDTKPK